MVTGPMQSASMKVGVEAETQAEVSSDEELVEGEEPTPTVIWLIDPDEPTDNEESSPREQEPDSGKDGAGLGQPI